ncbi:unnamed protein product [Psylliodes chrysocephalus]|uniref:C2 domain-containing protein n=1 Tax=Psylliodes chrysocephalus TaxID=3402493 RepID=A0A9P0DA24_9CUCU|nr:unnamed protein product [Psylliodes chrysocephala]
MTFGETLCQKKTFDGLEAPCVNAASGLSPEKIGKNYYYVNLFDEKPCLWILRSVPFFKKRIYNSNILIKITQGLKMKLKEIECLFESENQREVSEDINQKLLDVTDFIWAAGKKYIDIISSYSVEYNTILDVERRKLCLQEINDIIRKTKNFDGKYSNKKTFRKLQKIYNRIEVLIDDIQDCWPDIILWLVHGNKNVAFFKIPARDLIFSQIDEERGQFCGIKRTICFYDHIRDKRHLAAKMDVKMYLTLDRQKFACRMEMPPEVNCDSIESVPRCLATKAKKQFELRCYIFQGKIVSGFDKSGLGDPFVRVIVQNQLKETRVINKCLNPIWDQTLVFPNITIDEFYVPSVLMEIYDKDELNSVEFIGRAIIIPKLTIGDTESDPLKLEWYKTYYNDEVAGEVLGLFEYIEVSENSPQLELPKSGKLYSIPKEIKPELVNHKIEVLFWGMRDLGKVNLISIKRPRITVFCGDNFLHSDTIENAHKNLNFASQTKSLSLIFPVQKEYAPPLRLKMYDSRRFGVYTYAGCHITTISSFIMTPITVEERKRRMSDINIWSSESYASSSVSVEKVETVHINIQPEEATEIVSEEPKRRGGFLFRVCTFCCKPLSEQEKRLKNPTLSDTTYEPLTAVVEEDVEDYDWWTKFYASVEKTQNSNLQPLKRISTLKVYENELEQQPEFKGFTDMLTSFEIIKGKRSGDSIIDKVHISGIFKGSVKIYQWPLEDDRQYVSNDGYPLEEGAFNNYPENIPLRYLLRVYMIRGLGLRPKDLNGTSDPYLVLKLNDKVLNDRAQYIPRNVNPIFGKCFELTGTFPQDYLLKILVWDMDVASMDDLIGETEIDLENRFYSKHMASCGIAETYEETGYNAWRGQNRPSTILAGLCKKYNIQGPVYKATSVKVGSKEFIEKGFAACEDRNRDIEVLALTALRRWREMPLVGFSLVPEHVETRSLFHPTKPGKTAALDRYISSIGSATSAKSGY